ncbi:MAG: hypothetical protein IJH39_00290 [Clostridia bacterium]|nr:hypothetical protein [Clostridia bacterium]
MGDFFMYYVEENDKQSKIAKLLKAVKVEDDKILLPVQGEELSIIYQQKLAKKTYKILQNTNSNKVVLSKKINNYEYFKNYLYSENIEIVSGKWFFKVMIPNILDYVIEKNNLKKQEIEISLLLNDLTSIEIEQIEEFANEYKRINIVTNHIEKFKKLEQKISKELGIIIVVSNNKKKSLLKSQIIVNYDFPNELVNKFYIYDEAFIIDSYGDIKINSKRFNGKIINDFKINIDENEKYNANQLYEAKFFKKQSFEYVKKKIEEDEVKIIDCWKV